MGSFISALYQFICCCNTNNDIDHETVEKENSNSSCQTDRPVTPHPNSNSDIFEPRNIVNTLSPVKEPEPEDGNRCYLSCNHELSQERYKHFVDENNPDEVENLSDDEKCCDSNECCVTKECCDEDNICCTEDSKCCEKNIKDEVEILSDDEKCCDSNECCVTKECCDEDNVFCTEDSKCCNENIKDNVEILSDDEKCCESNECCVTKECCDEDNVCCTEDSKCCNENIKDNVEILSDDEKLSDCEENETDSIILEDPDSVNAFFNDTESLQSEPDNVPLEVDQDISPDISTIPQKEITHEVKEHEDLKEHVDEIIEKVIEENI